MPAVATNGMVAGIYNGWLHKRDSNGYPKGTAADPNVVANGSVLAPYRLKYPISFTPPAPSRRLATRVGGMAVRGQLDLGVSSLGTMQMEMDSFDETFHGLISNTAADVSTVSEWAMTSPNVKEATLSKFILGLTTGYLTEAGNAEFLTIIFHNVQIRPIMIGGSQGDGVNPNPLQYEIVPDTSSRTGIGRLYSGTGLSVAENSDIAMMIRYSKEIVVTTFVKDGTASTFTLPYLPTTSDATGAASNSITNNGVTQAVTSVNTATGLVTLTTAGTAGHIVVAATPTEWVAL